MQAISNRLNNLKRRLNAEARAGLVAVVRGQCSPHELADLLQENGTDQNDRSNLVVILGGYREPAKLLYSMPPAGRPIPENNRRSAEA